MPKIKSNTPKTDKRAETIANRIAEQKKELIIKFKKNPVLQSVCHQVGITRSTVYRWMEDDPTFANFVKQAQSDGNEFVADMAKGQIIKHISDGSLPACFFWLKTRKKEEFAERVLHEHRLEKNVFEDDPELEKTYMAAQLRKLSCYFGKKLGHFDVEQAVRKSNERIDTREKQKKERENKMREQLEGVSGE